MHVCSMRFQTFAALAVVLGCTPNRFKDHVGDNVYSKQDFYLNGWRFVCDNVSMYIYPPKA